MFHKPIIHFVTAAMLVAGATAAEMRVMRGAEGETIRARLEGIDGDTVTLRREDWKTFDIPLDRFAPEEQARIRENAERLAMEAEIINEAAGHPLVTLTPLDGREAASVAEALSIPRESETSYGSSWRRYAGRGGRFMLFDAMPYSTALYSDADGNVAHMSVVYANKGDFGTTAGFGQDHFEGGTTATSETLAAAMDADAGAIAQALTAAIGEPTTQRFGERQARRTVNRWDWNGHSFILSNEEDEYVGLAIMSTEAADDGGRTERISNSEIRERLAQGVSEAENGDVWISDIPMVDQGPKGYCVPATFERVMRALGVEADMYLLAMIGETQAGGGTSVRRLIDNVSSHVRSKGRRPHEQSIRELRIRSVKRRIDEGIPVMWVMHSMPAYNEIANQNTIARARENDDPDARLAAMRERLATLAAGPEPEGHNHICMIVGYNEKTNELAVSDSWGARYELRWVPLEAAQWVSRDQLFYILP